MPEDQARTEQWKNAMAVFTSWLSAPAKEQQDGDDPGETCLQMLARVYYCNGMSFKVSGYGCKRLGVGLYGQAGLSMQDAAALEAFLYWGMGFEAALKSQGVDFDCRDELLPVFATEYQSVADERGIPELVPSLEKKGL